MARRYPLEPLRRLTGWSVVRINELAPCNGTEYRLRMSAGVTERIAERLAIVAGFVPYEVWPEMLDHAIEAARVECAADGCPRTFMPNTGPGGHNRRYCSNACRARESMRRYRSTVEGREADRRRNAAYKAWLRSRRTAA